MTDFNFAAELEEFFKNTAFGTPDNITRDGCIYLALLDNQLCKQNNIENGTLWNYWRHKYPFTHSNPNHSKFENYDADTYRYINFSHFDFGEYVDFSGAIFTNYGRLNPAQTFNRVCFKGATFIGLTDFSRTKLTGHANFSRAKFTGHADFSCAKFTGHTDFNEAEFAEYADFSRAAFRWAIFKDVIFNSLTNFSCAIFTGEADFRGAKFIGEADFRGAKFKKSLRLDNCTFKELPPLLFNAELCEDFTVLHCDFKDIPANDIAKRAYGKIKEHYAKIKNTQGELEFAVYELEQERLLETRQPNRFFFDFYKLTANYGQSILRPLCYYLLSFVLLKAIILISVADLINFNTAINWHTTLEVCKIIFDGFMPSVASKPLELGSIVMSGQAEFWFNVIHAIQKFSSIVGWFLIALAMKNLFKIRGGG